MIVYILICVSLYVIISPVFVILSVLFCAFSADIWRNKDIYFPISKQYKTYKLGPTLCLGIAVPRSRIQRLRDLFLFLIPEIPGFRD